MHCMVSLVPASFLFMKEEYHVKIAIILLGAACIGLFCSFLLRIDGYYEEFMNVEEDLKDNK